MKIVNFLFFIVLLKLAVTELKTSGSLDDFTLNCAQNLGRNDLQLNSNYQQLAHEATKYRLTTTTPPSVAITGSGGGGGGGGAADDEIEDNNEPFQLSDSYGNFTCEVMQLYTDLVQTSYTQIGCGYFPDIHQFRVICFLS